MHVRFSDPELQRPLMTFLRGEHLIVFADDDDATVEVIVPHLYDDRERQAIEVLLERFSGLQPQPVELSLEP